MQNIVSKDAIREFSGKIIGWVETDSSGNKQVRDFSGRILGTYDKRFDVTREFSGRIISQGDTSIGLLYRQ